MCVCVLSECVFVQRRFGFENVSLKLAARIDQLSKSISSNVEPLENLNNFPLESPEKLESPVRQSARNTPRTPRSLNSPIVRHTTPRHRSALSIGLTEARSRTEARTRAATSPGRQRGAFGRQDGMGIKRTDSRGSIVDDTGIMRTDSRGSIVSYAGVR